MLTKKITSLQHPIVRHLNKLRTSKRYRSEKKTVLLSGKKVIFELGASHPIKKLLISPDFPTPKKLRAEETFLAAPSLFKKITGLVKPEQIVAEVALPKPSSLKKGQYLIALDDINDPGNLGTLLRTALALGWDGVFLTDKCADPFNDKALRAAKGATFHLPIRQGSREELLALIEERELTPVAADIKGTEPTTLSISSPYILILGNEARGIHPTLKKISTLVSIPMHGKMESLNVASAGAILMYTLKCQN